MEEDPNDLKTSVGEAVQSVSTHLGEDASAVSLYARKLIEDGLLPKCRGRSIATINTIGLARLVLATALRPKFADTARTVRRYWELEAQNVPDGLKGKMGDAFTRHLELIGMDPRKLAGAVTPSRASSEFREEIFEFTDASITNARWDFDWEFLTNYPAVIDRRSGGPGILYAELQNGEPPELHIKRSVTVSSFSLWSMVWHMMPERLGIPHYEVTSVKMV